MADKVLVVYGDGKVKQCVFVFVCVVSTGSSSKYYQHLTMQIFQSVHTHAV